MLVHLIEDYLIKVYHVACHLLVSDTISAAGIGGFRDEVLSCYWSMFSIDSKKREIEIRKQEKSNKIEAGFFSLRSICYFSNNII
jgi:hypothetical protein